MGAERSVRFAIDLSTSPGSDDSELSFRALQDSTTRSAVLASFSTATQPPNAHEEVQARRRSSSLLLASCVTFFFGFGLLPTILGFMQWIEPVGLNWEGKKFESGHNYFPSTISEMCAKPDLPPGKVFTAFGFASAALLLYSAYPWRLQNVYLGGKTRSAQSITILRHIMPSIGLMILTTINVIPKSVSTSWADRITTGLHSTGAVAMFGTYMLVETATILRGPSMPFFLEGSQVLMKKTERMLRGFSMLVMLMMGLAFMTCNVLGDDFSPVAASLGISGQNTWKEVSPAEVLELYSQVHDDPAFLYFAVRASEALVLNGEHGGGNTEQAHTVGSRMLLDTAHGTALALRIASYVFEVLTGACMAANMVVIWWFCPERLFVLSNTLTDYRKFDAFVFKDSSSESSDEHGT
eukprot:TRINITY_DN16948_c0_g1_i4.p1 TRINITY_DN16948_c0_g1~~TRINITY_DN16948_c0_g1_i4.p1  ORF type:complete len:427 (-),score=81.74 TRINITY_DN16948_c0_g1_i4:453-1682(-)